MEQKTYTYKYPHPSVTCDCVIFSYHEERLWVLLVERGLEPYRGRLALPGGFMLIDESAEECARRELEEETGISEAFMEQFHVFSAPGRDPRERVVTIAFYALIKMREAHGGSDAHNAMWVAVDEVPELAFDHNEILRMALETLRHQIHFQPLGFELLPEEFTMRELQSLYETILGVSFDRRNFKKKMQHLELLNQEETGEDRPRSPFMWSFNREKYEELKRRGWRLEF